MLRKGRERRERGGCLRGITLSLTATSPMRSCRGSIASLMYIHVPFPLAHPRHFSSRVHMFYWRWAGRSWVLLGTHSTMYVPSTGRNSVPNGITRNRSRGWSPVVLFSIKLTSTVGYSRQVHKADWTRNCRDTSEDQRKGKSSELLTEKLSDSSLFKCKHFFMESFSVTSLPLPARVWCLDMREPL